MKLIVGLGNPGKKYEKTRHNVGYAVLDKLKTTISNYQFPFSNEIDWKESKNTKAQYFNVTLEEEKIELIKPLTSMNESGLSVAYARNKYKVPLESIYVVHDDLDIELGEYKIQKGKGPREHKGLLSVYEKLSTKEFWHVRVGVNNDKSRLSEKGSRISGEDYVLMKFSQVELMVVEDVVVKVVKDLQTRLIH